jgi:hypothetical protein
MASGITYGICKKKKIGVKRTASVSFGENLKYKRNISRKIIATIMALSTPREYKCPRMKRAAINTIKLAGRIEHKSEAIRTIAILFSGCIYPNLLFIIAIVISAKRNFHT